jgi:NAD(P)-dependent dehydrogenase (short-subunit alcohol dehydrogenase family)
VVVVAVPDGVAIARRLVAEGATVVVTGEPSEDLGALLREMEGAPGRVAFFDDAGVDALVEFIAEQFT